MASFSDSVVEAMRALFPEELADKAWDNTGLLLGQPELAKGETEASEGTVLLTNDLTAAVVDEAIQEKVNVIVCYHPVIFRPLKSITSRDPMQALLLRLIAARIAVYCPHTAMDAAPGGLNDWLCDILLAGQEGQPRPEEKARAVIQDATRPSLPDEFKGAGYGRAVELKTPVFLTSLIENLSVGLGNQRFMSFAVPPHINSFHGQRISNFAVCAGSGADLLKDSDAELLVTGEMSHHSALRHVQLGQIVVTVFHSNSERQYLGQRLRPMLEKKLGDKGRVLVSQADRDPFQVVDVTQF